MGATGVIGLAIAVPILVHLAPRASGRRTLPRGVQRRALPLLDVPDLGFGAFIAVAIELGGNLFGSPFVPWRAFASGLLAVFAGARFFARAMQRSADDHDA